MQKYKSLVASMSLLLGVAFSVSAYAYDNDHDKNDDSYHGDYNKGDRDHKDKYDPTIFSASGKTGATDSLNSFINAIGADKLSRIGWDGVRLDGTDVNPNTRIIDFGKTVEIPVDRFKNVGALFADPYSVSGDGFSSVNPHSAGQFPAFTPNNTFIMFDPNDGQFEDRQIQQSFVLPNTDTAAGTRGFGAIFIDVELPRSTYIEYFGKDEYGNKVSLAKLAVPKGASGEPEFVGAIFADPIVAEVELTVGSKALFSFDGKSVKSFGPENLSKWVDLVVTDDFVFGRPETLKTVKGKYSWD